MIQRIQTVYLAIGLVFLTIISFGVSIFNFKAGGMVFRLNVMGVQQMNETGENTNLLSLPFYLGSILLMVVCFSALILFKNLKTQLAVARFAAMLYFVVLVFACFGAFLGKYFTNQDNSKLSIGLGFYLLVLGFPLILLAVKSINKDKKLIDSVNRLR
jgi:uncharacterized paraquat-inducible protein A